MVHLAAGIKQAMKSCPMEASDLESRLNIVEQLLVALMSLNSMDDDRNVLLAIEHRDVRARDDLSENVHQARALLRGPLQLCYDNKLLFVLGTRQVYV